MHGTNAGKPQAQSAAFPHIWEGRDGSRFSAVLQSSFGHTFSAEAELPDKALGDRRPAALIAPSQVVLMRDQQTLDLALQLRSQGMVVMRFDRPYAQRPGPPSTEPADLAPEIAELESALSLLSSRARVDARRVLVIGRAVSAVAAYAVFAKTKALRALVLLEPPCIDLRGFALRYPDLASTRRPVLFAGLRNAPACPGETAAMHVTNAVRDGEWWPRLQHDAARSGRIER